MAARRPLPPSSLLQRVRADLRGDPRKRTILLVLLPVLLIVWVPVIAGGSQPDRPVEPAQPLELASEDDNDPAPTVVDGELRARMAALVEGIGLPYERSWSGGEGDRPFALPSPVLVSRSDPSNEVDEERERAARLVTTSTILSETHGNVAVIDGVTYRRGDSIQDLVIEDIGAREVIVRGRFGRYELRILTRDEDRP